MIFNLRNIATSMGLEETSTTEEGISSLIVQDRSTFASVNPLDTEISDALLAVARAMELKELPNDAKSLVTLDRVGKGTPNAIAISLEKILDITPVKADKKNFVKERFYEGKNRLAVVSPLLIMDRGLKLKLALIHPPRQNNSRDAKRLYIDCINTSLRASTDLIEKIKSLFATEPSIMADFLKDNIDQSVYYEPYRLSFESRLKHYLNKAFVLGTDGEGKPIVFKRIDTDLFERQLIARMKEAKQLIQILPGYHLIASEVSLNDRGEYLSKPEIVTHYEMIKISLENKVLYKLKEMAQKSGLKDWLNLPHEPGDEGLEKLISQFPWDNFKGNGEVFFKKQIGKAFELLNALAGFQNQVSSQKEDKKVNQLIARYVDKIKEDSKNEAVRDLTSINFETEQFDSVKIRDTVSLELMDKMKGVWKTDQNGQNRGWFVHPHYFAYVEVNLAEHAEKDKNYRRRYEILKEIKEKLKDHPELNKAIAPEQLAQFQNQIKVFDKRVSAEKNKEAAKNAPPIRWGSVLLAGVYSVLFLSASLAISGVGGIALGGAGFALYVGIIHRFLFPKPGLEKSKEDNKNKELEAGNGDMHFDAPRNETVSKVDEKKLLAQKTFYEHIIQAAKNLLVPVRYATLAHKSFSNLDIDKSLGDFYRSIPELKSNKNLANFEKNPDTRKKLLASIDGALVNSYVKIKIPENLTKLGLPNHWYIHFDDWRSKRGELGEGFRKLMEENRTNMNLLEMYKHLVNCVEKSSAPQNKKFIIDKSR